MGCLSSSRAPLLVNGSSTKQVYIKRDVRQSDPLNLFLFICTIESVHLSMEADGDLYYFIGLSFLHNDMAISHIIYVAYVTFID